MKFVAIIPARSGSKSIKDKNIQALGRKPLLYVAIENALKASFFDKLIVSTDSLYYKEMVLNQYKDIKVDLRSAKYSGDDVLIEDTIKDMFNRKILNEEVADVIFLFEPTSPFIHLDHILKLKRMFEENSAVVSAQTITKFHATDNPDTRLIYNDNGKYVERVVEHKLKKNKTSFFRFGNLCASTSRNILIGGKFLNPINHAILIPRKYGINIDSTLELEIANMILPNFENLSDE